MVLFHRQTGKRFSCAVPLFACGSLQDAANFRKKYDRKQCFVYKCEVLPGSVCFRADMRWLDMASKSIDEMKKSAVLYWQQQMKPNPFWEFLVVGRTKFLQK